MRLGLLSGSFRAESANQAALRVVDRAARVDEVVCEWIAGLELLPNFDPTQVDTAPDVVVRFQDQLRDLDGLLIAAPEYAAGVAGSTKNALDWLVGAAAIYQTPVGIISAGTTGGTLAIDQLVRTLSWQGAWPMATLGIAAPQPKMSEGEFVDEAVISELNEFTANIISVITGTADDRQTALNTVVERYGIDIARFGDIV